jgi:hypothetical protein
VAVARGQQQTVGLPAGVRILVSLQDFQDMQNHFCVQIASGLATLQNKQGKDVCRQLLPEALLAPVSPTNARQNVYKPLGVKK